MNHPVRPGVRPAPVPRPAQAPAVPSAAAQPRPAAIRPAPAATSTFAADAPARSDAENRRKLEALLPRYDRLRDEKVRAEGDFERATQELAEAEQAALDALGTKDPAEIEKMLHQARAESTATVDEFEALVTSIEADLKGLSNP